MTQWTPVRPMMMSGGDRGVTHAGDGSPGVDNGAGASGGAGGWPPRSSRREQPPAQDGDRRSGRGRGAHAGGRGARDLDRQGLPRLGDVGGHERVGAPEAYGP